MLRTALRAVHRIGCKTWTFVGSCSSWACTAVCCLPLALLRKVLQGVLQRTTTMASSYGLDLEVESVNIAKLADAGDATSTVAWVAAAMVAIIVVVSSCAAKWWRRRQVVALLLRFQRSGTQQDTAMEDVRKMLQGQASSSLQTVATVKDAKHVGGDKAAGQALLERHMVVDEIRAAKGCLSYICPPTLVVVVAVPPPPMGRFDVRERDKNQLGIVALLERLQSTLWVGRARLLRGCHQCNAGRTKSRCAHARVYVLSCPSSAHPLPPTEEDSSIQLCMAVHGMNFDEGDKEDMRSEFDLWDVHFVAPPQAAGNAL